MACYYIRPSSPSVSHHHAVSNYKLKYTKKKKHFKKGWVFQNVQLQQVGGLRVEVKLTS